MKRLLTIVAALVALIALLSCQSQPPQPQNVGAQATAAMVGPEGVAVGTVTLTQTPHGVLIAADVTGLVAGGHGFHIHTIGSCTPNFAAAGDHFNPGNTGHGILHPGGLHAGDLPNIYAHADGADRRGIAELREGEMERRIRRLGI